MRFVRPAAVTTTALLVSLAGITSAAMAQAAVGPPADSTPSTGPFGMVTKGLGATDSYGEPTFAVAPDGQHLLASTPGCGGVCYWYSADDGQTWGSTTTAGSGGDSEIDFIPNPDGGITTLSADLAVLDASEQNSWINTSLDYGHTWNQQVPQTSAGIEQDRQWFAHSPDGKTAYLVYHDFAAEAEVYAKGTYNATTHSYDWAKQDAAHPVNSPDQLAPPAAAGATSGSPVSILDQGVNTYSGPMLVDPNGKDQYVVYSISDAVSNSDPRVGVPPFGPVRSIAVAHSGDSGSTWENRYAVVGLGDPSDRSKDVSNGTMFPWGFVDQAGTVYVVFDSTRDNPGTDNYGFYYVYSKDKGKTWSNPFRVDGLPKGTGSVVFNTGAAVRPGVIDMAWLQKDDSSLSASTGDWYPWFAQVDGADTATPHLVGSQRMTDTPDHKGGVCIQGILCGVAPGSSDRSLADFFELAVNPVTGMAEVAYAQNAHNRAGENGKGEVVFAQQTLQPVLAPGTDVPEVPRAVLLPLAAMALLGAAAYGQRRRWGRAAA